MQYKKISTVIRFNGPLETPGTHDAGPPDISWICVPREHVSMRAEISTVEKRSTNRGASVVGPQWQSEYRTVYRVAVRDKRDSLATEIGVARRAVFKHLVKKKNKSQFFKRIDSFGTAAYHVGETPDQRSAECCIAHDVPVNHRAQKLTPAEFDKFDFLLVMDESNLRNAERVRPRGNTHTKVKLFGDYGTDPKFSKIVDDPYYGGDDGFEWNFQQISHFSDNFLKRELE